MSQFGRQEIVQRAGRLGGWSIRLALIALALVVIVFAFVVFAADGLSDGSSDAAGLTAAAMFFIVAPALHVAGAVMGLIALVRGRDDRVRGLVGLLINAALLVMGTSLAYLLLQAATAFT